MVKRYSILLRIIIGIIILSLLKVDNWVDKHTSNYAYLTTKSFLFDITRLNWQYGFFTSKSDKYQYLKTEIALLDDSAVNSIPLTYDGSMEPFGSAPNSLRLNTAIQQISRDSIYLEAGSRSIALYLFNKNPSFRNVGFLIQAYNCEIAEKNNHFVIQHTVDTLFDKVLSY
jgi:hypothetical protein